MHFLYTTPSEPRPQALWISLWQRQPSGFLPERWEAGLGSGTAQSDVVIFDRLAVDITVVDKNGHYSLKHTLLHLTHL